jgi:hypothetical protein
VHKGDALEVIGQYDQCDWLQVVSPQGILGWVQNFSVYLALNKDCEKLPVGEYQPYTGYIILDHRDVKGAGELEVDNGMSQDGEVILTDREDDAIVAFYIRAGDTFTLTGILDGVYRIFFSTGEKWDDATNSFSGSARYLSFEDTISYYYYYKWMITLHPVEGGTADTQVLSPEEFPRLGKK